MFVVDLMHEFELGVWKAVFIHLIRMMVSLGGRAIQELNLRCVVISYDHVYEFMEQVLLTGIV